MTVTIMRKPVPHQREQLLDTPLDRMLGMVDRTRFCWSRNDNKRTIIIAGVTIVLDPAEPSFQHQLERLASAIEASIAYERASAMLAAVGVAASPVPLWLVTGSSVLAQWLAWSRSDTPLRRVLVLSDQVETAPVAGLFSRSTRAALGQTAVRIRVSNGLAVASRIQLSAQPRCTMTLGRTARMTIFTDRELPEAVVAGLAERDMSQLGGHPFFVAANLVIKAARNERDVLVIDLEHDWQPLAPVPDAALAAVPADADPACPWRPTQREVAELYMLVDTLRGHGRCA